MNAKLSGADLWAQIIAMPRPHRVVDFPRTGDDGEPVARLVMQVLRQEEQITAAVETERFTKKMIKDIPRADEAKRAYDDIYNNQGACEILFLACRQTDNLTRPFFPSSSAIRQSLTPDEVGVLYRSYLVIQDEVGPIVANISDDEREAWIVRLQQGGSRVPLASLSLEALTDLAFSLACRTPISPTDTSSPGSLLDET